MSLSGIQRSCDDQAKNVVDSLLASLALFDTWNIASGRDWNELASKPQLMERSDILRIVERRLSQSLCGVRTTINALAPVNRLPTDILKNIFDWLSAPLIDDFLPSLNLGSWRNSRPTPQLQLFYWLRVTCVCRHWRDVALSCATNWSTISIGPAAMPPAIVEFQLLHSGNVPIDLHAWAQTNEPEMLQGRRFDWSSIDLKLLVPRLRSLHLHAYYLELRQNQLLDQLTVPAPLLENLTISPTTITLFPDDAANSPATPRILPKIFDNHTPRLKSLSIGCYASWPENDFSNLTRLCLSDQNTLSTGITTARGSWTRSHLFTMLEKSPNLEELVLSNTLPLVHDDGGHGSLHLPRLKLLRVGHWDNTSLCTLLSALQLPRQCLLSVTTSGTVDGRSLVDALCALEPVMTSMAISLQNMTRLYFQFWDEYSFRPLVLACGHSGLYIESLYSPTPESITLLPISPSYSTLYTAMNLGEIWMDTMGLNVGIEISLRHWCNFYDSVPNVKKVVIIANCIWENPALECILALGKREDALQCCLPSLQELHLIYSFDIKAAPLDALQRVRAERDKLGAPIRKLVVGAQPPLELYEENISVIQEKLGPDVICGIQDLSFNWSPFREHRPYGQPFWPETLSGVYPGLWRSSAQ